ncbi:DUF3618 domain-containing protein [Dactylosporangium sp. CS-033363]|uniref:DUF3618 domain-containing protein n=1 Tax=Dactylosporangium sp. CS-033363 TaxID=3239935 RepID=UPI003D94F018
MTTTANPALSADELRAEIVRTRAALGETVEALAAKADVKARVKDATGELADRTKARALAAADVTKVRALAAADMTKSRALAAADVAKARAVAAAGSVSTAVRDPRLRRPVPLAVLGGAVAGVAALIVFGLRARR